LSSAQRKRPSFAKFSEATNPKPTTKPYHKAFTHHYSIFKRSKNNKIKRKKVNSAGASRSVTKPTHKANARSHKYNSLILLFWERQVFHNGRQRSIGRIQSL
jgi:hypothetical protein